MAHFEFKEMHLSTLRKHGHLKFFLWKTRTYLSCLAKTWLLMAQQCKELGNHQCGPRHRENFSFITRRVNHWYWFHPSSWYSEHWWYNSIKNRFTDWWATFSATFCHQALFQYLIRCPVVRCHEVSSLQDLYLELSNHSEIWQAPLAALLPMCLSNFKAMQ